MFEPLEDLDLTPSRGSPIPLPAIGGSLQDLNLEDELYASYTQAKSFYDTIKSDSSIPPNQIAQVINTLNTILKEITKMRTEVYNAERIKNLEFCMITAMKEASADVQAVFFENYERLLGK